MPDRHEDVVNQTNRLAGAHPTSHPRVAEWGDGVRFSADSALGGSLPTVREVLALAPIADGIPEVVAGFDALDALVRWVHVSESAGVARLLQGGELLLSTGSAWPSDPALLRALVAELVGADVSGLIVELGTHFAEVPPAVVEAAEELGLAVIALNREVRFVTITEAVHGRIISEQMAALRARDEVRERFTALALRGSPSDYVVRQLSQTLGSPVVLENLAHEVIAADIPASMEADLFLRWEARSRLAHRSARTRTAEPEDWLLVPVEARGMRWGTLIALPGPTHPAGRMSVLEQGAIALALGRLADPDGDEWARIGRTRLLDGLLTGRYAGVGGASARLEAAGLPIEGARLYGMVITGTRASAEAIDRAARALAGRAIGGAAPQSISDQGSIALLSLPNGVRFDDSAALQFLRALTSDSRTRISIGRQASALDAALLSLQEAIDLARDRHTDALVRRADDRPLVRLVTSMRDDHRLIEHGERMLAPLIEYDLARGGDLLDVLGAMLSHPGNRTAAAGASHLSRSVFYQRLALIGEMLGADLDDGETQTALHIALLVRRSASR